MDYAQLMIYESRSDQRINRISTLIVMSLGAASASRRDDVSHDGKTRCQSLNDASMALRWHFDGAIKYYRLSVQQQPTATLAKTSSVGIKPSMACIESNALAARQLFACVGGSS